MLHFTYLLEICVLLQEIKALNTNFYSSLAEYNLFSAFLRKAIIYTFCVYILTAFYT